MYHAVLGHHGVSAGARAQPLVPQVQLSAHRLRSNYWGELTQRMHAVQPTPLDSCR